MFSSHTYAAGYPASYAAPLRPCQHPYIQEAHNDREEADLLITACVSATVSDDGQSGVNRHQLDDEVAQRRAHVVGVHGNVLVGAGVG